MASDDRTDIPPSVREVLAYFLNHPGAAGSVRDLAESRIHQEIAFHSFTQVSEAVAWLLAKKLLVHTHDPILTLNDDRIDEAQQLVGELPPRDAGSQVPPRPADTLLKAVPAPPRAVAPHNVEPRIVEPHVAAPPRPALLGTACLAWIDATLLRHDERNPLTAGDHPGLSRDAATVRRLLSPVIAPNDTETAARSAADDERALMQAVEDGDDNDPIAQLYRRLQLTPLEFQAVLLCLAPEIDAKYQTLFGILNDDLHGRRSVTLGLLCRLLGDPVDVRQALEDAGHLTRWRLLDHGAAFPHADEPLRLDPLVVAWLFGQDRALTQDSRLAPFIRRRPWPGAAWLRLADEVELIERLRDVLSAPGDSEWMVLAGGEKNGSRAALEAAAALAELPLLRIVIPSPGPSDPTEIGEVSARLARAGQLTGAVAVVDAGSLNADALGTDGLRRLFADLKTGARPVIVIARDVESMVAALPRTQGRCVHIGLPLDEALASVYAEASRQAGLQIDDGQAERLALAYPMSLEAIENVMWLATLNGAALRPASEHFAALSAACRRVACPDLPRFGRRVDPVFRLRDVVLPGAQHAELEEIVTHVRHATQVMHAWGFRDQLPYGRGVTALFSGPSGTGKTMAAQAIARELDTDAYVVDLSRVVSKYIGESEKNLDAVFNDAERAGAVLLFDEADALFGKRSEIKDAHDRYANIEVAYLLQRLEAFSGLAILTTNFRQNLDAAFVRRIRFIVDFTKPDERAREAIWRRCLGSGAPLARRVNLRFLARRLDLTGGTIQQIAIRAAFAAAAEGSHHIDLPHVMTAARAELLKLGLTAAERELAAFDAALRASEVA